MGYEKVHGALEVVGDGGEVDLDAGFGEASPSLSWASPKGHSSEPAASFPCPEDFLDPASHPMDRLIPLMELAQRFGFVAAPHAGRDDPRYSALCPHGIPEGVATTGAVASGRLRLRQTPRRDYRAVPRGLLCHP